MWPVGSIYICDKAINPNTYFGGTWVQLKGGFLYGSTITNGQNAYSTGNGTGTTTNNHTLTIDEIPSHSHRQYVTANNGNQAIRRDYSSDGGSTMYDQGINTGSAGGGKGHAHAIPYIAAAIWRRTA